ncbi:hypothetical protein ACTXI4_17700 [Glutamicibacter ardleyensis]|uniref:hypothetical protein n=1 Tax=Glutamicibacter ardleyensis TaxID=225894 RepID=UPI003FD2F236
MDEKMTQKPKVVYLKSISKETLLSDHQIRAVCREKSITVTEGAAGDFVSNSDRLVLLQIVGPVSRPYRYKPSRVIKDPEQAILDISNRISRLRQGLPQRDGTDTLAAIAQCIKSLDSLGKQRNLTRQDLESLKVLRLQLSSLHRLALTLPAKNVARHSRRPNVSGGLPSLGKKKR